MSKVRSHKMTSTTNLTTEPLTQSPNIQSNPFAKAQNLIQSDDVDMSFRLFYIKNPP